MLFRKEVKFLGRIVSEAGVSIDPSSVDRVNNWPVPKCTSDVEVFLGFLNYHREYLQTYSELAAPLYQLTGAKGRKEEFIWSTVHQRAFDLLKKAMSSTEVLGFPLPDTPFILDTDASDSAIGAELLQI